MTGPRDLTAQEYAALTTSDPYRPCSCGLAADHPRAAEAGFHAPDCAYRVGTWTCALCDEENTGETCATSWCRLTPAQAETAAGWIACVECGCGHPDITNGGERCPACKEGDARDNWYWDLLEDLRARRLT